MGTKAKITPTINTPIKPRTIQDTIDRLQSPSILPSSPPPYSSLYTHYINTSMILAVESMKDHTSDEGWQLALALSHGRYLVAGRRTNIDSVDVPHLIRTYQPGVVVLQDKREWDISKIRNMEDRFERVDCLAKHTEIFRLTIIKDAHQNTLYHKTSADEIGVHGWITYYHPTIICHLAPYVRQEHLIRTYHSIDPGIVPAFNHTDRKGTLLSGAISKAYPLRTLVLINLQSLPTTVHLKHPGYHRNGCITPQYLKELSKYRVAICTSSIYGYALRKIVEATACGCRVLTDLPLDDIMPVIDGNLTRVHPDIPVPQLAKVIQELESTYDPDLQYQYSSIAKSYYDYRMSGFRLVADIERLRSSYHYTPLVEIGTKTS